jgi:uncharacterized protein DUF4352
MPSGTGATALPPSGSPGTGEKIRLGDEVFITLVESEYSTTGYSQFFKPAAGNIVYAFLVEFEGIDPAGASYNPLYFKLKAEGFEYNSTLLGGKEPKLSSSNDLAPGDTVRGWVSFEAPKVAESTLTYEPFLSDKVSWTVTIE